MRKTGCAALAALGLCLAPVAGLAQDDAASPLSIYLGVTATTNYISSGVTQTGDKPAIQPYVELDYNGIYGGLWLSNVDFGDDDMVEFDLYLGYRGEYGLISYDVSYYRYLYNASGDCCGELVVVLDYAVSEEIGVGWEIDRDFDLDTTYLGFHGSLALPWELSLSGGFGLTIEGNDVDWNVGLTRALSETVTLDVRYHDSNLTGPRVNLSLSWDTDWASLMAR